mmetsp:Transcript_26088/g.71554  ORF Transcript_26088/g.71554 Transcript_26088/m.71554 type:complete len:643 (-) Transcript_26088:1056-2984(-)
MRLPYHSPIALLATIICLFAPCHLRVRAHCVDRDGHIDHVAWGCNPTSSPVPSEKPSTPPTDSPTESPAPSPSPSEIPSSAPTESPAPSAGPTDLPSVIPTPYPSLSPTGSTILTVEGVELIIHNVTGEREMDKSDVEYFETKTMLYLQNEIGEIPGVFKVEVENILVTNQTLIVVENIDSFITEDPYLRRRQSEQSRTDLMVIIDVALSIVFARSGTPELDVYFEEFFQTPEKQEALRASLEQEVSFAEGIFIQTETISSSAYIKKRSNGTAVTGAILAALALIVGSGLVWMWIQTRRSTDCAPFDSRKLYNVGTISKSFDSDEQTTVVIEKSKRLFKINTYNESHPTENHDNGNEIDERSSSSSSQLMYIPAIMPTLSNIEVPDTPGTAFAPNGLGTPANANGFATPANADGFATPASVNGLATPSSTHGLVTPASVMSRGGGSDSITIGGISKLVVPTAKPEIAPAQILKDINSSTSRRQKIPLPPNILGSIKSPFRRDNKHDDDFNSSSMFGAGVVAGENNVGASDSRKKKTTKNGVPSHLPPTEIGGPVTPTFSADGTGASSNGKFSAFPYEGKKNNARSRKPRHLPPVVIGRPPDKVTSDKKATKNNDHGVVDIVDEIAYLYSTNSGQRGSDVGSI